MRFGNISQDDTQEAIAITEIEREPGDTRRYERTLEVFLYREVGCVYYDDIIQNRCVLFLQKRSYQVDLITGSCKISDLGDWQNFGVRDEYTYVGTNYIGSMEFGLAGVKVNEYILRDRMQIIKQYCCIIKLIQRVIILDLGHQLD